MTPTSEAPNPPSEAMVLATYRCDEGTRQRVDGVPRITDRPDGEVGRCYLVEDNISSMPELQAILDDYQARPSASAAPRCRAGSAR